ncbi:MAG: hypothetical protein COA53_03155 [Rhodobacteraceae bacterium]|nr:MAG: hypothetical protein COA53_03155 [Paracoccaceae bacterium]
MLILVSFARAISISKFIYTGIMLIDVQGNSIFVTFCNICHIQQHHAEKRKWALEVQAPISLKYMLIS